MGVGRPCRVEIAQPFGGRLIYGPGWKEGLSSQYQISTRTIGRWASGKLPVPDWLADELANTAEEIIRRM